MARVALWPSCSLPLGLVLFLPLGMTVYLDPMVLCSHSCCELSVTSVCGTARCFADKRPFLLSSRPQLFFTPFLVSGRWQPTCLLGPTKLLIATALWVGSLTWLLHVLGKEEALEGCSKQRGTYAAPSYSALLHCPGLRVSGRANPPVCLLRPCLHLSEVHSCYLPGGSLWLQPCLVLMPTSCSKTHRAG